MDEKLKQYAKKILTDAGCDLHTYGGEFSKHIMDDLKQAFPGGMPEYTYLEVANAILAMSRPEPIKRSRLRVLWDNEECCDAFDCDTLEEGMEGVRELFVEWMIQEQDGWGETPTPEQVESWNCMIENCAACVEEYDPRTDTYDIIWEPSDDELMKLGWGFLVQDQEI